MSRPVAQLSRDWRSNGAGVGVSAVMLVQELETGHAIRKDLQMQEHDVLKLIKEADKAISAEDFDALMAFYADDAVLVVQPGQFARGKVQIRRAFEAIAAHFGNALTVSQGKAQVIEGAGTALVIMETNLHIADTKEPVVRRATYVFVKDEKRGWLCTVDNSYGTDLIDDT